MPPTSQVDRFGSASRVQPLDGAGWTLSYLPRVDRPAETPDRLVELGYRRTPATIPGSIELDLHHAGVIDDPFFGDNVAALRDIEYGDWWYETTFSLPPGTDPNRWRLHFGGIDTVADVFVNGRQIAHTTNMLVPHEIDVSSAVVAGDNTVSVHIFSALIAAESRPVNAGLAQVWDDLPAVQLRKPAHMFGWDISPRIISAGLHRSVALVERPAHRIADWYLRTISIDRDGARCEIQAELSFAPRGADVRIRVRGEEPVTGSSFETTIPMRWQAGRTAFVVPSPALWFPRNYGDPRLYDVTLTLLIDGIEVDVHEARVGLRVIEHDHDARPLPDGRFGFVVNGTAVRVMGTNWVPVDAIHARDAERMPRILADAWESGINLIRCWGGSLYEDDSFFDWADEHGVLVWQDFAFACARYPQDAAFLAEVRQEADAVTRRLRNHASLAIFSGGNETDDAWIAAGLDPADDAITRVVLPAAVRENAWATAYVPNSPAQPTIAAKTRSLAHSAEQHLWGERASFKAPFYAASDAVFVGEIGIHGAISSRSIDRFMPAGHGLFRPDDRMWNLHESDHVGKASAESHLLLMAKQAELFFGPLDLDSRDDFIPGSQIHQAEAYKFFIENSRLTPHRTGIVWWNLADCWPQVSASLVDYYFDRRLAFPYVRRAQAPLLIAADEASGWSREVVLINDSAWEGIVQYELTSVREPTLITVGETRIDAGGRVTLTRLPLRPEGDCHLFLWRSDVGAGGNHYLEGSPPFDLETYRTEYLPRIAELDAHLDVAALWPK